MRAMELKVWVDGVQRVVCGVTELTTCQEVVIALAQAIGQTGRYTLLEKWRETERHLAPNEKPVVSLNKWGQYACDVQLVLQRTGPSFSDLPDSDGSSRVPERGLYRQSLPPWAKLRPSGADRSMKRKEPKRKSLTFSGGAKGLRDIFGKSRDSEAKQQQRTVNLNLTQAGSGITAAAPPSPARQLGVLVQLQKDRLQVLESQLRGREAELQGWERAGEGGGDGGEGGGALEAELLRLEQQLRREEAEMEEEELWQNQLRAEQDGERRLREQLALLRGRVQDCEAQLEEYQARIQSMEAGLELELQQQEAVLIQQADEEALLAKVEEVRAELDLQTQLSAQLESSYRAVDCSQGQVVKRLQEREQELEQLTKELRHVNLQQFIQQTGTKVTVLPARACEEASNNNDIQSGPLRQLGSAHPLPNGRALQGTASSRLNPEGIYV